MEWMCVAMQKEDTGPVICWKASAIKAQPKPRIEPRKSLMHNSLSLLIKTGCGHWART